MNDIKNTLFSIQFLKVFLYFIFVFSGALKWIDLPFGLDLTLVSALLCVGMIVISLNKITRPKFEQYLIFGLILFLNLLFLLSYFYTISSVYAQSKILGILLNIFTVVYPLLVFRKPIFRELKLLLYIVGVFAILGLFFLYFNGLLVIFRDSSQFIENVPTYLAIGIVLSSCFMLSMESPNTLFVIVYRLSLLFLLFQLGGRGPIFNLFIVLIAYYYLHLKDFRLGIKAKIIGFSLILLFAFYLQEIIISVAEFNFDRFNLFDAIKYDESFIARIDFLNKGIQSFFNNPFFGLGIGSSGYILYGRDESGYPHNLFIEALMEVGVIGGIVYLSVYFYFVKFNWKIIKHNKPLSILFFIALLYFFDDNKSNSFDSWRISIFWIMIFLVERRHDSPIITQNKIELG